MVDELNPDETMDLTETGEVDENMILNLEEASDNLPEFKALPPGIYNAIVENTENTVSSNGNPMISWQFRVVDQPYEGRLLFYHTVLNTESGQTRLKKTLLRIIPDIGLKEFRPATFCDEGVAIGRPCKVKVRVKPYKGKRRNNITEVLAPEEGAGSFMDEGFDG